jgi:hypothetical protein
MRPLAPCLNAVIIFGLCIDFTYGGVLWVGNVLSIRVPAQGLLASFNSLVFLIGCDFSIAYRQAR